MTFRGPNSETVFRRRVRLLLVFWVIVALIAAIRWEIVDTPAYYDYALALWPEAEYLAASGFDYYALRYEEPHSVTGIESGARTYMTSVMPTLLALVMRFSPSPLVTIRAWHFFMFANAAALILLFHATARRRMGRVPAVTTTLAMITTPVMCTQVDMLGMEMPLCLAAVLTGFFVSKGKFHAACAASFAAFLVKPTGIILTFANVLLLLLLLWSARRRRGDWWRSLGANLLVLVVEVGILAWGDSLLAQSRARMPMSSVIFWCPDLVVIAVAAMVLSVVQAATWFTSMVDGGDRRKGWRTGGHARVKVLIRRRALEVYSLLVVIGTLLAASKVSFVPRYLCVALPFFYLLVGWTLFSRRHRRGIGIALTVGITILNLVNWNGVLFPDQFRAIEGLWGYPAATLAREGSFLERSHEYLWDHREMIEAMKAIEEYVARHPDAVVIWGLPPARVSPRPSFGYVTKPIFGHSIWRMRGYEPRFQRIQDLSFESTPHPVFFRTANIFYGDLARFNIPLPEPGDEIIYRKTPDAPLVVFRKQWPGGTPGSAELRGWYLRRLWPDGRLFEHVGELLAIGEWSEALRETRGRREAFPKDPCLSLLLANLLVLVDEPDRALPLLAASLEASSTLFIDLFLCPRSVPVPPSPNEEDVQGEGNVNRRAGRELAEILKTSSGNERKLAELLAFNLIATVPSVATATTPLMEAVSLLAQGRADEAIDRVENADPPESIRFLARTLAGEARSQQGRWRDAEVEFQAATDLAPEYVPALLGLGIAAARLGEFDKACHVFEKALQNDPSNAEVKRAFDGAVKRWEHAEELDVRREGADGSHRRRFSFGSFLEVGIPAVTLKSRSAEPAARSLRLEVKGFGEP